MTPVENPRVTSVFGGRTSPITGRYEQHNGQDMVDNKGNRNLRAIWATIRTEYVQGYNGGRGYTAYLYYSNTLRVLYQHLASFSAAVLARKPLKQGDSVGVMGTTGDSTGVHLHIEVQELRSGSWVPVLPTKYTQVPNTVGIHAGNNNMDGGGSAAKPKPENPNKEEDNVKLKIFAPMDKTVSSRMLDEGVVAVMGQDGALRAYHVGGDARMVKEYTDATLSAVFEGMRGEMQADELMMASE